MDPIPPLLRTRRGLMFTALPAIAVMAVLGGWLALDHHESVVRDREAEMLALADAAATNARGFVDDRFATLATAANSPGVRRGRLAIIREYLPAIATAGEFTAGVAYVDRDLVAREFSRGLPGGRPSSVRSRTYARRALEEDRPVVSDVVLSPATRTPVVVFAYPVPGPDGSPAGVLLGGTALDQPGEGVEDLLYAPEARETVLDGADRVIAGPPPLEPLDRAPPGLDPAELRRRDRGVLRDLDSPEGSRIAGFSTVDGVPWLVVVDRPSGDVIDPLDTALVAELFALGVLALLGVLVTFLGARRLDRLHAERDAALAEQRTIALRLQRSLLPDVPKRARVDVRAGYTPAAGAMAVGGDWYDVVELADGRVALSVGDVAGHGLGAAAAMGQLRSAARMLALGRHEPADAVERLNDFARTLDGRPLATLVFAVLDPDIGRLRYCCAGHPPPIVVRADGAPEFLQDGRSPLLGIEVSGPRPIGATTLRAGETFVCYTDGLVERPDRSLDEGLAAFAAHAAHAAAASGDLQAMTDALLAGVQEPRRDDAAVLCLRLAPVPADQPSSVPS